MIDEIQSANRAGLIGSSDAAAICGVDPYRTAYDVWAEKTGRLEKRFEGNDATEIGQYLEPSLITYAARSLRVPVERHFMYRSSDGRRVANLDGIVLDQAFKPLLIEAKTSGILSGGFGAAEQWGDPFEDGPDGIPETHLIQTHHALDVAAESVAGLSEIAVVALVGGRGFLLFKFDANPALCRAIKARCDEFWERNIQADTPPMDSAPSHDVARAMRRVPEKIVEVPAAAIAKWRAANDRFAAAKIDLENAKAEVLAKLADAEAGYSDAGGVTFYEQSVSESVHKAYTTRVMRFSKKLTAPVAQKRK